MKKDPKTELVQSLNISPTDAVQILSAFGDVNKSISLLDPEFPKIINQKKIDESVCVKARGLRLKYQKVRKK